MIKFFSRIFKKVSRVKTPTVLQIQMSECGAAVLAIILRYYNKFISLEELRVACDVSRDGVKASNIIKAAKEYGLTAKGISIHLSEIQSIPLPFVVFWGFNHFVVVEGFTKNKVYLNDPAVGHKLVSAEEFDKKFTGVVLTFQVNENFQSSGKKSIINDFINEYFFRFSQNILFIIIIGLILIIPGVSIPFFTRIFIDGYLVHHIQSWMNILIIGMISVGIFTVILTIIQENQFLLFQKKLSIVLSSQFLWHLLHLPIKFFSYRRLGEIIERVDSNLRIAQFISREIITSLIGIISMFFYAIFMFYLDFWLTVTSIFFSILYFTVLRYIAVKSKDDSLQVIQERGQFFSTLLNGIRTIESVKTGNEEDNLFFRISAYKIKIINEMQKLGIYTQFLMTMPVLLTGLTSLAILFFGGIQILNGKLSIGSFVAFQMLAINFFIPINNLVNLEQNLQNALGRYQRIKDVLNFKIEPYLINHVRKIKIMDKISGKVELKNISFGYSRNSPPLIENFNLSLKPGMRVAVIGVSGSGKTTLVRLLTGIEVPWSGEILFDGKPREEISRAVLMSSLSAVNQEIFLFEGSVYNNIILWDHTIDKSNVILAAKDACLDEIINSRPSAYDTEIGEDGSNFSGGERQQIEIARALAINPTILVLDEATTSVDSVTEKVIDDNIRRRGCSCIIISHRLSTIRDCDEIIVMEHGKIGERGKHGELIKNNGIYKKLIQTGK